jgi:hypothetical protein
VQPVAPAALPHSGVDLQLQYEHYRNLFIGMMSKRSLGSNLSVLLTRGMKDWINYVPSAQATTSVNPCKKTETTTQNEFVVLVATMIGGA